jgi:hypothetical protein
MSRIAIFSVLCAAACAHDHFNRRDVGEMKNASPAVSPWPGPAADPVAATESVVDRVHGTAVQVYAKVSADKISVVSGVLAGGGLVLTDLRALLVEGPDGDLKPAARIAVLTVGGVFPARIIGGAPGADVAVLELPVPARGLEGSPLAEKAASPGDHLLAVRASLQGEELAFDVIGFSIERAGRGLPATFAGAPVFDAQGELAGLLVNANEREITLVPAPRLLQILDGIHPAAQADEHI